MKTIAIQFAMHIEAEPSLNSLKAKPIESPTPMYPFKFFQAATGNFNVIIGIAGNDLKHGVDSIGTIPAAMLAETLISRFKPSLLINAGTAGGYESNGAKIAEVYLGYPKTAFHSRRIPIPEFESYAIGNFPTADITSLNQRLGLKVSNVSTGDSLDCTKEDAELIQKNQAYLKEMEAAAISWVCEHHFVPMMPIKAITDFVDHPTETAVQFFSNYQKTVEELKTTLLAVLDDLSSNLNDRIWTHHSKICDKLQS